MFPRQSTRYPPFCKVHTFSEPTDSIATLAFSPSGALLASGGDNGNIFIWDPLKGELLHRIIASSSIVCMAWDANLTRRRLFVGCVDGTLAVIEHLEDQGPINSVMSGTKAPIFAVNNHHKSGHIAFAIGSEVHLAKEIAEGRYVTFNILPAPEPLPNSSDQEDQRIRGRDVVFKEQGNQLIVAYLNHGVVCWDLMTMSRLWRIVPIHRHGMIGHAALSSDESLILLSNLNDGADLYSPGQSHPRLQLKGGVASDVTKNVPLQVAFVNGTRYASCGSTDGTVGVWDVSEGRQMQILDHQGCMVQALTTFNHPRFTLIATATANTMENTTVQIWKAEKSLELRTLAGYIELWNERLRHKLDQTPSGKMWRILSNVSVFFPIVVSIAIFCQYGLGLDLLHFIFTLRTATGDISTVALGWWCSYLHSVVYYLRHRALVLVGYLYKWLQGGIEDVPLPQASPLPVMKMVTDLAVWENAVIYL